MLNVAFVTQFLICEKLNNSATANSPNIQLYDKFTCNIVLDTI